MSDKIVCPKCDGYIGGHATGSADICTCTPMFNPTCQQCAEKDRELERIIQEFKRGNQLAVEDITKLRANLQIAREALKEIKTNLEFYSEHIWCDMNCGTILDKEDLIKDGGNKAHSGVKIATKALEQIGE